MERGLRKLGSVLYLGGGQKREKNNMGLSRETYTRAGPIGEGRAGFRIEQPIVPVPGGGKLPIPQGGGTSWPVTVGKGPSVVKCSGCGERAKTVGQEPEKCDAGGCPSRELGSSAKEQPS